MLKKIYLKRIAARGTAATRCVSEITKNEAAENFDGNIGILVPAGSPLAQLVQFYTNTGFS